MNRYECSGCGLRSCEGECFNDFEADYPEDEPTISTQTMDELKRLYGNPFGTEVRSDPLLKHNRRHAA